MTELLLLLIIAGTGLGLARKLKLPAIPFWILGGLIAGQLSWSVQTMHLEQLLEMGLIFLVFASGMELNPSRFKHQWPIVWKVSLLQFSILVGIGWLDCNRYGLHTTREPVTLLSPWARVRRCLRFGS
jgi:Kef-type K+ transport system membrane component KefB